MTADFGLKVGLEEATERHTLFNEKRMHFYDLQSRGGLQ